MQGTVESGRVLLDAAAVGGLWREIFKLCFEAPAAAPGLADLREQAVADAPLAPNGHRVVGIMPPLGHLTPLTRELSSEENYAAGTDAVLSLVGSTAEVRAERAANLRSALERHGTTPGAAQWIQHEAMVLILASFGSPHAPTRARLHAWTCAHEVLFRECVEETVR
ncbi:hypothetical protein [Candidatus Poriferisodalis sp.]|uniref:hypothetical protein n=1 Tax=Candidatus Poriferisodalis sp. TaxID=3101277 RepID=UPI003B523EF2